MGNKTHHRRQQSLLYVVCILYAGLCASCYPLRVTVLRFQTPIYPPKPDSVFIPISNKAVPPDYEELAEISVDYWRDDGSIPKPLDSYNQGKASYIETYHLNNDTSARQELLRAARSYGADAVFDAHYAFVNQSFHRKYTLDYLNGYTLQFRGIAVKYSTGKQQQTDPFEPITVPRPIPSACPSHVIYLSPNLYLPTSDSIPMMIFEHDVNRKYDEVAFIIIEDSNIGNTGYVERREDYLYTRDDRKYYDDNNRNDPSLHIVFPSVVQAPLFAQLRQKAYSLGADALTKVHFDYRFVIVGYKSSRYIYKVWYLKGVAIKYVQ